MTKIITDLLIIGAGPAGLTAAIYGARAGLNVVLIEGQSYGGQIINTPAVENYPGFKEISGFEFATNLHDQVIALGARVEYDKATSISNSDSVFHVQCEYGTEVEARAVIVATGAVSRHMELPYEEKLTGRGVSYCATCDGAFYKGKVAAVYGGGNTAVDDAIYLSSLCEKVYLIHRRSEFRAEKRLVDLMLSKPNIVPVLSQVIDELLMDETSSRLKGVKLKSTDDGSFSEIDIDGLFVAIGQTPASEIFKDILTMDNGGYITAGEDCTTNVPGLFVAGDVRSKKVRQLTTATADGAVAALAAYEYLR